jgi:DNA-binding NarL/FixJ family response regulator
MKRSIVIVDDHLLIAKALRSIIDAFEGFEVLFECENGKVLIDRLTQAKKVPNIILLDISMPIMDGFETAMIVSSTYPGIQIMALTMQNDDESLIKMIKCGASGYLHKNVHPKELENALCHLDEKGYYYPEWAASKVFKNFARDTSTKNKADINEREKEFLQYACSELTYKEIGEKMFCSARTIEGYRDNLFEKLGLKTRVALALYAVKTGIHKL